MKTLEESCQSLYCQKSFLIADNGNLISQVERVGLHLQSLENRLLISEGTRVNQEDKDPFQHDEQLKCPLRACKDEHDNHESSFKSQISYLGNQIHFVREENKIIKEELEETQYKFLQSDIDRFIFEQCLTDLNEKCLFLLEQCQKYMEESKRVENLFLEFKEEWTSREKGLASLSDCNEKLLDGLHVMLANDTKKVYESSDNASDNMLHLILNKIADLQASILVSKDETSTIQEIFFLQTKNHELLELNEQLWKDLDSSRQHEEMLNIELEFLYGRLSDLQDTGHAYDSEILKLLEEHEFLSQTLYEFRERNSALEIENTTILENAMTQEHLSLIFSNSNAEKLWKLSG
ncbi:hypothetical protein HPP92_011774 [Vanilla planifolia]|uniref:Uncharacterized protein n=1 Tax=Vanilla planifolia TaxID=51239 RepID=A0A835R4A0_VANPL|nr:hypothetical protein HPP92_012118 [Vanilla planifolia]KAG0483690.1 hypothetical protein HPP92_011774 [Vanilla planifolia]